MYCVSGNRRDDDAHLARRPGPPDRARGSADWVAFLEKHSSPPTFSTAYPHVRSVSDISGDLHEYGLAVSRAGFALVYSSKVD
jgi:hypothetical protein